jgi:tetratricopeptide (TPR) repeat protein
MSRVVRLLALGLIIISCQALAGASPVWAAAPLAGKIISLQGQVAVRPGGQPAWVPAGLNKELFTGDAVKTGPVSRAAILCVDESQIKLNENTVLVLKRIAPSPKLRLGGVTPVGEQPAVSLYQVLSGEIWLRNKNEKFRFELETPAVTATIRGTEFNLRVNPDGSTRVTLLEGRLDLVNPYGTLVLHPGEEGLARPGQAPTKRLLLQPADAVQWSLYYPGIFSYRDLPLKAMPWEGPEAPETAAAIRQGEAAYDRGNLDEARRQGESVLKRQPQNGAALTLLGWVSLQRQAPEQARGYFLKVRQAQASTVIGLALAAYRLGDVASAYRLMEAARQKLRPTPVLTAMLGYFALLAGKVDQARAALKAAASEGSAEVLARSLLAQIYLAQNHKDAARQEASQALARAPDSPLALLTMGLVRIAYFDLPEAVRDLQKALKADPSFVDAYVYLAKIWLGSEYLARARRTIEAALTLAPREAEVLSLAGFVRFAYRDYAAARQLWTQASAANPALGEPHLGLSLCHFRFREFDLGLTQMLTATLLEPRVALYQSTLGKALYQVRTFDKALEVYDYAKTLDPQDPTPYFYKGIALTDLNRPGEAIQEINRSIALNDNTAIFRSRLMLDRDLAVRNYNLALAYNQLGLTEWAFSKAVTAVASDPVNSSAHLFLAKSYTAPVAQAAELLLYRVLSPANENTFYNLTNTVFTNDYTPMFEMPYYRGLLQGGIGAWQEKNPIQDHAVTLYGGRPGASFIAEGAYLNDLGFRDQNSTNRIANADVGVKWEPSVYGDLTGLFQYRWGKQGDLANLNDFAYRNNPQFSFNWHLKIYELAYLHRFNPQAGLLAYGTYQTWNQHLDTVIDYPDLGITDHNLTRNDWEFLDLQLQKQLTLGGHTFLAGVDYFDGHQKLHAWDVYNGGGYNDALFQTIFRPPEKTYSFYLLDYWRLKPGLVLELGLFKDFCKNARDFYAQPLSTSLWSPRFGLNWQINPQHTVRLVAMQHLNTHLFLQPLVIPTEVAGFPWVKNVPSGSKVKTAGAQWEAQWDPKTFSVLRFTAQQVDAPDFVTYYDANFNPVIQRTSNAWKSYRASLIGNRILSTSWGLSAGFDYRRIVPDLDLTPTQYLGKDFSDADFFLGLSFLHRSGWQASVKTFVVKQFLKDRADNFFGLVNLGLGKEFPQKRGFATLQVDNLFNRHFYYALEPLQDPDFAPARRILFKLGLYF